MSTWVLLRGLTREARHWGDFPRRLAAAFPAATVLSPDLPGNGRLDAQRSPANVAGMVAQLRTVLREQGHVPPYRVLAMSLGAMVTVAWAQQFPHEIEAAVLINTSLRPISPFWQRLRPRSYLPLLLLAVFGGKPRAWEETILQLTTRLAAEPQAVLAHWIRLRESAPVSRANALRQLRAAIGFRAPRAAPAVPLLLLASEQDGLVDPRCSARLARCWHLPLAWHPEAGHDLPLDDPEWLIARLQEWSPALVA